MATAYGGSTERCKACDKTVYLVDQLVIESKFYHKACFRCHHCKSTLKLSNYSSIDGVLYCKPHYDQLFKMTGSLNNSFEGAPKPAKAERSNGGEDSRFSTMFVGTQDKCVVCKKTVYPLEKIGVDGTAYHKQCFKCSHGGCTISTSNHIAHEGKLYCKHHHAQLFMTKGNFSQFSEDITKPSKVEHLSSSDDDVVQDKPSDGDKEEEPTPKVAESES